LNPATVPMSKDHLTNNPPGLLAEALHSQLNSEGSF
jgi:hypothetical protein